MLAVVVDQEAQPRARLVRDYGVPEAARGETTVRVLLAGICSTDLEITRGYMGFSGVLGHEFVGVVEDADSPLNGRRVVCEINCACGRCDMCGAKMPRHCRDRTVVGIVGRNGCFAERICVPERNLHVVPESVSDRAAVFVEPLAAAVHVLDEFPIQPETRVAVIGTGRLGLLVAQVLAIHSCRLTAFGRNPHALEFCRSRGIQAVDSTAFEPRSEHDLVVECSGSPDGLRLAMSLVRPRGTIVLKSTYQSVAGVGVSSADRRKRLLSGSPRPAQGPDATFATDCYAIPGELNLAPIVIDEIRVVGSRCGDFPAAIALLEQRKVDPEPMIRCVFPLADALAALTSAAEPGQLKVLLEMPSRR